jgi:hypothetical protein
VSDLARRYRRLLAIYPRDHRERAGEEMLGVLMADAGERTRPGFRNTVDVLWGALRLHLRRVVAADGGVEVRDVLAIVSLLGPIASLAGAARALHELAWWVRAGALSEMPVWQQIPDTPVWVVWFAVAVLALLRRRVAAAVVAWVAVAVHFAVVAFAPAYYAWTSLNGGWVLLGLLTAGALTWSSGPARGLALVGRRGVFVMAATVVVAALLEGVFHRQPFEGAWIVVVVAGGLVACGLTSRAGRRAALVLAVPLMPVLLWDPYHAFLHNSPPSVEVAVFYGVPLVLLFAVGSVPRWRRTAA